MQVAGEACVVAAGEGGAGAGQSGQLASPGMKQAMCCGRGMH